MQTKRDPLIPYSLSRWEERHFIRRLKPGSRNDRCHVFFYDDLQEKRC